MNPKEWDGPIRQDIKHKTMNKTLDKLRLIRDELEQNPGQSVRQLARTLKLHRKTVVSGLKALYRLQVFPFRLNGLVYLSEEPHEFHPATPNQRPQVEPKSKPRSQAKIHRPGEPLIPRVETNGIGGRDMGEYEIRRAWYD